MDWKATIATARAYWKRITAVAASVIAVVGLCWGGGEKIVQADDWIDEAKASHQITQINEKTIGQLVELEQQRAIAAEADLKARRAVIQERVRLCAAGKLRDKNLCEAVGVKVDDDQ